MPLSRPVLLTSWGKAVITKHQDCPPCTQTWWVPLGAVSLITGRTRGAFLWKSEGDASPRTRTSTGLHRSSWGVNQALSCCFLSLYLSTFLHHFHHACWFHRSFDESQHERCKAHRTRRETDFLEDCSENSKKTPSLNWPMCSGFWLNPRKSSFDQCFTLTLLERWYYIPSLTFHEVLERAASFRSLWTCFTM